jgi:hypothetical protein
MFSPKDQDSLLRLACETSEVGNSLFYELDETKEGVLQLIYKTRVARGRPCLSLYMLAANPRYKAVPVTAVACITLC